MRRHPGARLRHGGEPQRRPAAKPLDEGGVAQRLLAEVSLAIGRNKAYLQQYLAGGMPRVLSPQDSEALATLLGCDAAELRHAALPTPKPWKRRKTPGALTSLREVEVGVGNQPHSGKTPAHERARFRSLRAVRDDHLEPARVVLGEHRLQSPRQRRLGIAGGDDHRDRRHLARIQVAGIQPRPGSRRSWPACRSGRIRLRAVRVSCTGSSRPAAQLARPRPPIREDPGSVTDTMNPDPHDTARRLGRILGLTRRGGLLPARGRGGAGAALRNRTLARLTGRAVHALRWSALTAVGEALLSLAFLAVLSRLLTPRDFGAVAIALIFVGVIDVAGRLGIGPAIVQRAGLTERHVATGFVLSAALGAVLSAAVWFASPAIALFFDDPEAPAILKALSAVFVIAGLGEVSGHLLRRQLRFGQLMLATLVSQAAGYGPVAIALHGFGAWSLVGGLLARHALYTAAVVACRPPPRRPIPARREAAELLRFGTRLLGLRPDGRDRRPGRPLRPRKRPRRGAPRSLHPRVARGRRAEPSRQRAPEGAVSGDGRTPGTARPAPSGLSPRHGDHLAPGRYPASRRASTTWLPT